jgi:hypothetical protein
MMPRWVLILILILAVLYFIFPRDVVPDFIPVTGWIEDILFLSMAIYLWKRRLRIQPRRPADYSPPGWEEPGEKEGSHDKGARREADPYTILGVSPSDSPEKIKRRYYELISKYHPDRVDHLGEEFQEMADARTRDINQAYEQIKKEKGIG